MGSFIYRQLSGLSIGPSYASNWVVFYRSPQSGAGICVTGGLKFSAVPNIASVITKWTGMPGSALSITSALKPLDRRNSAAFCALISGSSETSPIAELAFPTFCVNAGGE